MKQKQNRKRKLVAPIIVTAIVILQLSLFAALCFFQEYPLPVKLLGLVVCAALAGVSIFVLAERIREIKGGEEDDLGNY